MSMLKAERRVVAALTDHLDEPRRAVIAGGVDNALRSMPEHLRAGVAAESLLLTAVLLTARARGRLDADAVRRVLESWERSRIGVLRQYPRAFSSLVLFIDCELEQKPPA
jgi:hypothetical protein